MSGDGGDGTELTAGGVLVNSGAIHGGNGGAGGAGRVSAGANGAGGAGVVGAGLAITNSGTIVAGLAGDGATLADAVHFTGGVDRLTLLAGSAITDVVAYSAANSLVLGGSADSGFDASLIGATAQYEGFGVFKKAGASTWTLTGSTAAATSWRIDRGTLELASLDAAGTGAIDLSGGVGELAVDNAALLSGHLTNAINGFGKGDRLDVADLAFTAGASAAYDAATHLLSVSSGGVIDTFTLIAPLGAKFTVASDGVHGTEVYLGASKTVA